MSVVVTYFVQVGIALDMFLNAILGGRAGQTISLRSALGAQRKIYGWCVLCRFLSWFVQRDHCQDQLDGIGMNDSQYFRAIVGLVVLSIILIAPIWFLL